MPTNAYAVIELAAFRVPAILVLNIVFIPSILRPLVFALIPFAAGRHVEQERGEK
jgi:hypothetical protein